MKVRYYHDEIGVNSRLDSIQAAVLSVKLERLDDYCNARRKAADYYDAAFVVLMQFLPQTWKIQVMFSINIPWKLKE